MGAVFFPRLEGRGPYTVKKMKKYVLTALCGVGLAFQAVNAEMMNFESANREIPVLSKLGPVSIANFNLNRQGNTIVARKNEKIFSTLNFSCDVPFGDPDSLYQIVIGYENVGPQKCIFNELGYRFEGKEGILSFFCEAPDSPGVYDVQCKVFSAGSSVEALQSWWDQKVGDFNSKTTIGRIIVK